MLATYSFLHTAEAVLTWEKQTDIYIVTKDTSLTHLFVHPTIENDHDYTIRNTDWFPRSQEVILSKQTFEQQS